MSLHTLPKLTDRLLLPAFALRRSTSPHLSTLLASKAQAVIEHFIFIIMS